MLLEVKGRLDSVPIYFIHQLLSNKMPFGVYKLVISIQKQILLFWAFDYETSSSKYKLINYTYQTFRINALKRKTIII